MSQRNMAPNFCSLTVIGARNLPNKGKEIDPFCTISMGTQKFMTATKEKTVSPRWEEQCDMAIVDDAKIKLTVYHRNKNALSKGDLIGRAYVSLRDLDDYDQVHNKSFKLANKDGKFDKERGEIEISLQFFSQSDATGSVLDLTSKKKHLSLSDFKKSIGKKLKSATSQKSSSNSVQSNQLGDQQNRFGGSIANVRDFLDDSNSETTSFAGSHLSLNSIQSQNVSLSSKRQIEKNSKGGQNSPYQTGPFSQGNSGRQLPDIVEGRAIRTNNPIPLPVKSTGQPIAVLGFKDVRVTPVDQQTREELKNLDREELLHVIAHQSSWLKSREKRVKDLESYADDLLMKIVEQCPTILQV